MSRVLCSVLSVAVALLASVVGAEALKNGAFFPMGVVPAELTAHPGKGASVTFLLEENGTTGYLWEAIYATNACAVAIEHRGPDVPSERCGAPGKAAITVTRLAETNTPVSVDFAYRRSWEKEEPAKRVRLVLAKP